MKRFSLTALLIAAGIGITGCSGAFWGGAGSGTVATGAGYELRARQQMQKLDADLASGKIDQREYDIRKDQIKKGSLAY